MKNVFIIAEIGINHNGDMNIAKNLIILAKNSGCDAVKFQKRTVEIVYSKEELDKPRESPWGKTQRAQKEGLEFSKRDYDEIDNFCKKNNIIWFASAWDIPSLVFLDQYNLKYNVLNVFHRKYRLIKCLNTFLNIFSILFYYMFVLIVIRQLV